MEPISERTLARKEHPSLPRECWSMYEVPGFPPLNEEDIDRYDKAKKKLIGLLPSIFKRGDLHSIEFILDVIALASEADQNCLCDLLIDVIQCGLDGNNEDISQKAIKSIVYLPEAKRTNLINAGLHHSSPYIRSIAARIIFKAPQAERTRLIEIGLNDPSPIVRENAARMIAFAPQAEQDRLGDFLVAAINKELDAPDVSSETIKSIAYVSEAEGDALLAKGLDHPNPRVRLDAVYMIPDTPEAVHDALINKVINDPISAVRSAAAQINLSPSKRDDLSERLIVSDKGLKLDSNIAEQDMSELVAAYQKRTSINLDELANSTPLYEDIEDKRFLSARFNKTGSETMLLDMVPGQPEKSLKSRVIIRRIHLLSFLAWQKAFENWKFWQEKGFTYIPVEPIIRVAAEVKDLKKNVVSVFTRVLGINVATWRRITGLYKLQIDNQIDSLIGALSELDIRHGHLHAGNFCLVFERTEDGQIDLTKPPRVYLIDFDQAVSSTADDDI
ncbi:MAG: hypothetical protein WC752_02330 [Patescibacteria group bacterium]|jgi:hypothetical protein